MKSFLFVLTLFLLPVSPSFAALGQTADEITKTFGEPKSQDEKTSQKTWEVDGGMLYTVAFDDAGKSWLEQITLAKSGDGGDDAAFKAIEQLRTFADKQFGDEESWEFVDASAPAKFGGREIESIHGVVYWRLAKDGNEAYAMHVSGQPLIGIINADYAKANPKAPIFAGY